MTSQAARAASGQATLRGPLFALALLAVAAICSLMIGARWLPLGQVWQGIFGGGDTPEIVSARMDRLAVALLVGICLGVCGAVLQGVTMNSLAEPGLLGMNHAGSLAVVMGIVWLQTSSPIVFVWFALAGVIAAAAVVQLAVARVPIARAPITSVLVGAAVMAACTSALVAVLLTNQRALEVMRSWQVGSVAGTQIPDLLPLVPIIAIGLAITLTAGRTLDALAVGEELAHAVGVPVTAARLRLIGGAALLAACSVALAGPIAFVGLLVPHAVRALMARSGTWLLINSAICGALLVVTADTLGRVIMPPTEVAAGIVIALIGAPALIVLSRKVRA